MRSRPTAAAPGALTAAQLAGVRIEPFSPAQFVNNVNELMGIYAAAMNYLPVAATQRAVTARPHASHPGFACRVAVTPDGTVVGFGYGYTTAPGQWWHDLVRQALTKEQSADWMRNGFELSEFHVLPAAQGYGIGRRMLIDLADALTNRSILLSTPDADTRAWRLYTSVGFVALRRNYLFPGDHRPFAVMGSRLPLHCRRP